MIFSEPFRDTVVAANDSISLSFRFQVPLEVNAGIMHEIIARIYSMRNNLLSESVCMVHPEPFHNWDATLSEKRTFFYPRTNLAQFEVRLQNKGNTIETIRLFIQPDSKLSLDNTGDWKTGENIILGPFQDSVLKFNVRYTFSENRIFDISKMLISASTVDKSIQRQFLIEKYNDTYAPFYIDRALPHQIEAGFRSFSGNTEILPFIKARGISTFKNLSTFQYNFNYYSLTGNENLISNSYYSFLYKWKLLKVGVGAFSSQLGRNLYTRHGLMISNSIRLSPLFSLEAFVSQSFFTPKTSVAIGYTIEKNKISLHGSFSYDVDSEKKINTGSAMLQSNKIAMFKNQNISFNLYGYNEYHYQINDYTLRGYAWDIIYSATFYKVFSIQFINNYGSPKIPGPQMGLVNFSVSSNYMLKDKKKFLSAIYFNSSRRYHNYNIEGNEMPEIFLYDQYANFFFHSNKKPNHTWQAGPSFESYLSYRYSPDVSGLRAEYKAQKYRFEYKGNIFKYLSFNIKTGVSDIYIKESTEIRDQKVDFHLLGSYTFKKGFGISFNYDFGPLVNSGLYQSSGDVENHSFSIGPSLMSTYFKERLSLNLFANIMYRFDLQYVSFNINPKIEAYLIRDFYLVASGTYHFTRQEYTDFSMQNAYTYFELSIKKRFGKSDLNKWQKETRELKVILFKDDNGNGVKEDEEEGVPFVKTRLQLTNAADPELRNEFPVDIILLSNSSGIVLYNRLPKGFYDLTITPLGDVKEYFYVNRSAEKLEVSKNAVYYVPFQKANKITGKIEVTRQKFIKKGEETLDLTNIKITAYNKQGNSYSTFTLSDGSFTIFVPQNNTYYLRMGNVFGPGYKIMQNDINITIGASTNNQVVFNVAEIGRQVKFKETKPAEPDTTQQIPLKIKVLHGKFYENSSNVPVNKDAMPEFNIKEEPVEDQEMISGNFYVVITADSNRTESVKLIRIIAENGIITSLGYNKTDGLYYVFTKYFRTRAEAAEEQDRLKKAGLKEAVIFRY